MCTACDDTQRSKAAQRDTQRTEGGITIYETKSASNERGAASTRKKETMTASPQFAVKFGAHQAVVQDGEIESSPPLFPLSLSSLLSLSLAFLIFLYSFSVPEFRLVLRSHAAVSGKTWLSSARIGKLGWEVWTDGPPTFTYATAFCEPGRRVMDGGQESRLQFSPSPIRSSYRIFAYFVLRRVSPKIVSTRKHICVKFFS